MGITLFSFNCCICKEHIESDLEDDIREFMFSHLHDSILKLTESLRSTDSETKYYERYGNLHIQCVYCKIQIRLDNSKLRETDLSYLQTHECSKRNKLIKERKDQEGDKIEREEIMNDYKMENY